ncbi:MAG: YceI family protein [Caulobacteraceae bacterium]|nr:YceI family protein [Caulobacteraceae bacterium]
MRLSHLTLAGALASLALGGAALAQMPPPPSHDPATVQPGAYAVEPNHTRVVFAVNHLGFTTYYGDFTGVSGRLDLDPASPAASKVSISIPTASVSTTNATLDGELKGADWLDAAKFPAITFTSTKVEPTGPASARITGELTLHGVSHPAVLDAKFNAAGINPLDKAYTVGFDAVAHINRSDYDVKKYVPLVGDQVDVIISAAFEKAH